MDTPGSRNPLDAADDLLRRDRYLAERLKRCKAAWAATKDGLAVLEAVGWCWGYQLPIDDEIFWALVDVVVGKRTPAQRRSQKNAMVHWVRYETVKALREHGRKEWWHERRDDAPDALSWGAAYAEASERLEGAFAAGSDAAIRRSRERVTRDLRSGRGARYFFLKVPRKPRGVR